MVQVLAEGGGLVGGGFGGELAALAQGRLGVDALVEQPEGLELHPTRVAVRVRHAQRPPHPPPLLLARQRNAGNRSLLLQLALHLNAEGPSGMAGPPLRFNGILKNTLI